MPDEQTPEQPSASAASGANRRDAHPPMPRDKRGWQVARAPDGRGAPEQQPSGPPPHRRMGFLWFVLILVAINWLSLLLIHPSTSEPRITVPFKPFFLTQVQSGKVQMISTK